MSSYDDPKLYDLEIKKSKIHGWGLFTLVDIKKGEKIVPFNYKKSNVMKWKDFKEKYGDDFSFTYSNKRNWTIINVKNNRNIITYTNDDRPNQNCELKNLALYAIKNIPKGTELTLKYPHYNPREERYSKQNYKK